MKKNKKIINDTEFLRQKPKSSKEDPHAQKSYKEQNYSDKTIFVLGNESEGVSSSVESICDESIAIPMQRGVESLNVAVTASLLAFL